MEAFVARQPILDRQRKLHGYELLYRSHGAQTHFDGTEASAATQQVISSTLFSLGLGNVLGGKKAFLNFDQRLLRDGLYLSLPSQATVIEILESVEPTTDLLALCRSVRDQGYTVALDDFVDSPKFAALLKLAQLIKVDVQATPRQEQLRLVQTYRPRGIALLAEKVETYEEFEWTRAAGFDYFQGYFFARPSIVQGLQVPASRLNCLRLLAELQNPDMDFKRMEALIRADVALTYKLLCYVNSALFAQRGEIRSIERALMQAGSDDLRRFVALATLPMLATDKPGELATLSVVRARFCERLSHMAGAAQPDEAFLMGLFSALDALLDRPLDEALRTASVSGEIAGALLGIAPEESVLSRIFRLVRRYERGDWDEVERLALTLGFPGPAAGDAYMEATLWAERMLATNNVS